MGFLKEFKEFAVKGNALDMAVGIIIGAAFWPWTAPNPPSPAGCLAVDLPTWQGSCYWLVAP